MAYAAQSNTLPTDMWLMFAAVVMWTVAYDTFYAMVDRDDDIKLGIKSTAVLFGRYDRLITGLLQIAVLLLLVISGAQFQLGHYYFIAVIAAGGFFVYQQYLIRHRQRDACFKAFLNNHWAGLIIFIGIVIDYGI
ncbi:MAG: 4-hydroxybenzoate polyprenyltransferase [Oceanicoccus sp.]|jgi:4-hydroxybenzoate polyprenyltransferase